MSSEKSKSKIISWGIIGCGDVTEVKSGPAFKLVEGFNLSAVMRRNAEKAEDYANRHNISHFFSNADDLINEVDAVYIATPPDSHHYYALKVAKAGKPCCIEKPLSPSYRESEEIIEAFRSANQPLFVAYYRRTLPRYVQVKNWIDAGKIGLVRSINAQLGFPPSELDRSNEYNWRTDTSIAPAGYFDDLASHGLDLFTYFLGNIKDASGFSTNQQNIYTAKDAVTACWIHENGVTGTGNWNFGLKIKVDKVEINGSEGKIIFSLFDNAPVELITESETISLDIEHPKHIQFHHVEAMKNHLINEISHPSNGESALHTSWVMDKILGAI